MFSPREVETGRRFDDRVEIVKGLATGERIVVSGNFLVNSESRLKEAADMYALAPEQPKTDSSTAASSQPQADLKKTVPATADRPLPASGTTTKAPHPGGRRG